MCKQQKSRYSFTIRVFEVLSPSEANKQVPSEAKTKKPKNQLSVLKHGFAVTEKG